MFILIAAVAGMVAMYMLGRYQGEQAAYDSVFGPMDDSFYAPLGFEIKETAVDTPSEVVETVEVTEVVTPVKKNKASKTTKSTKTTKKSSKKSK